MKGILIIAFCIFPSCYTFSQAIPLPEIKPLHAEPIFLPLTDTLRDPEPAMIHRPAGDTISVNLNYMATGIINNTNSSNSFLLNNRLMVDVARKHLSGSLLNNWIYGRQSGILTNDDISSVLDVDLFKAERKLYYWSLLSYTSSVSLGIHSQLQTGAGMAYSIINRPEGYLVVSDGLLYESGDLYDSLYNSDGRNTYRRDIYQESRNSFRLSYQLVIKGILIFDGTGFLQNSLIDNKDYVIKGSQRISIKLQKWLAFTTSWVYNKFTRTGGENSLFTVGITIDKHF